MERNRIEKDRLGRHRYREEFEQNKDEDDDGDDDYGWFAFDILHRMSCERKGVKKIKILPSNLSQEQLIFLFFGKKF